MRAYNYALAVVLLAVTNAAFAVLADDVGDADSFGHQVKYLGAKNSPSVDLQSDCSFLGSPDDLCMIIDPAGTTPFNQANLVVFKLPAYSTRSLVCYSFSLWTYYEFANNTTTNQQSSLYVGPTYTIESPVFNNPLINDPFTGLPANGKISGTMGGYRYGRTLAPGDTELQTQFFSRECTGGMINKPLLQRMGLNSFQIAAVFANPITVTFSSHGNATRMSIGGYMYGIRLYGD